MKYNCYAILMILLLLLQSCSDGSNSTKDKIITVTKSTNSTPLFYSGIVSPAKTLVIPSPADGVIVEMPFQYGQQVKDGQLLFLLSSAKFITDYKSALVQYIKAKNEFNNNQNQLSEARFLHDNKLISDDDFKSKQSNYYASRLGLLEAKDTLENLLHQLNIKNIDLYKLTISDIDKITKALHLQISSDNLRITAPVGGTILAPSKSDDENKKIAKGDTVKQGDVLAIIGDMSSLSVRIKVNELTVNQLKLGQKVKISGIAFPAHTLEGKIARVDRQGESSNGGLPVFSVEVIAQNLTTLQQKEIHVGMSAKVEIDLKEAEQIVIPIAAVTEKEGVTYVKVYSDQTKKTNVQAVQTGKTTMDSVIIQTGLKVGDKIVVPN